MSLLIWGLGPEVFLWKSSKSSCNCGAISLVPLLSVFFLIICNYMQLCMYVPLFVSVLGCAGAQGHQISLEIELYILVCLLMLGTPEPFLFKT